MGHLITVVLLAFQLFSFSAFAAVRLEWDANPPAENVVSYRAEFGRSSGIYSQSVTTATNSATLPGLTAGQWFAAVRAINAAGLESDFSAEVSFNVAADASTNEIVIRLIKSLDLTAPRSKWIPVTTVREPTTNAVAFYALEILNPGSASVPLAAARVSRAVPAVPVPAPRRDASGATGTVALPCGTVALPVTSGSKRGKR